MALLFLAGCGGRPGPGALAIATSNAPGTTEHRILIATTREKDATPDTYFNGERSPTLNYASAVVSVPPNHVTGQIEWPETLPGDPEKSYTTRAFTYLDGAAGFRAALKEEMAKRTPDHREVILFIHGYNTRFPEALYRFAQITHDADAPRIPVLFTWASRGTVTDYVYDNNSATAARDGLERTLREILDSGVSRVHIIAHSMGNWVLTETIRQVKLSNNPIPEDRIGAVILAAPDLDIDVFKSQLRRIGQRKTPFIVLVSRDDKALKASSLIAGGKQRVGRYEDEQELANLGVIVIDLTELEGTDAIDHGKFTQVAAVAPRLRVALQEAGLNTKPGDLNTHADTIGTAVGNTAKIAITLPVRILTAPVQVLSGGQ
ncbi:alpha/beta hydrolase [Stappia albiluteola]|uniref:alpha/beta hydrolase n=1 Tax=Stappia albiluteola TaxID=2758565 RepID=UPI002E29E849|nr:alpha/beta fold hydrolase [Stappia albiluteola]